MGVQHLENPEDTKLGESKRLSGRGPSCDQDQQFGLDPHLGTASASWRSTSTSPASSFSSRAEAGRQTRVSERGKTGKIDLKIYWPLIWR